MMEKSCFNCDFSKTDGNTTFCINNAMDICGFKDRHLWVAKKTAKTGTTEEAKHYMTSKQPIEIMQELMTPEQFQGFLWGNVIKYSMRLNRKGKNREDAGKCWQYAKWMCEAMDGITIVPGGKWC